MGGLGKVSAKLAQELAEREYGKFRQRELQAGPEVTDVDKDFEDSLKRLKKAERIDPPKDQPGGKA